MPGWDVKIRPGKDEEKKADNTTTWVIVVILLALLLWWLYSSGALGGMNGCGLYQDGIHCNGGWSQGGSPNAPGSGHHHPHH